MPQPQGLASREDAGTHRRSKVAPNCLRDITRTVAPDRIAAIGSQALANLRDVLGIDWDIASVRCDAVPEVLDHFKSIFDREVVQIRHDIIEWKQVDRNLSWHLHGINRQSRTRAQRQTSVACWVGAAFANGKRREHTVGPLQVLVGQPMEYNTSCTFFHCRKDTDRSVRP